METPHYRQRMLAARGGGRAPRPGRAGGHGALASLHHSSSVLSVCPAGKAARGEGRAQQGAGVLPVHRGTGLAPGAGSQQTPRPQDTTSPLRGASGRGAGELLLGMRGAGGVPALLRCSQQGSGAAEGCCSHTQAGSCKKSPSESAWPQLRAERGQKAPRPG